MGTVINKTPNSAGIYRFLKDVNENSFNSTSWELNPDISNLYNVPVKYWKYSGTNVAVEMNDTEKTFVDNSLNVSSNEIGFMEFARRGNVNNSWLHMGAGSLLPSNKQPLILFNDGVITGLGFTNIVNDIDIDMVIYKNDIPFYTWEIRNSRYACKTNGLSGLSFSEGDRIGIFGKRVAGNQKCRWPMVTLQYRYTIQIMNEFSSIDL